MVQDEQGGKDAYEKAVLARNYAESRRVSWNIENMALSSKANRLKELVEEARSAERKVIVFSFFLDTTAKVCDMFGGDAIGPITGSVSPARRLELIEEFEKAPAGTVLVSQILSGGTGLNIQAASVVIICEPQLKPSIENQAISRAYRMGQTHKVLVYRLLCVDTIDERISEILEAKQAEFDAFADTSAAAEAPRKVEVDTATLNKIVEEEIEKIKAREGTGRQKVPEE